jgi:Ser/Thr protein kinase RdoA (MazF antagonist)
MGTDLGAIGRQFAIDGEYVSGGPHGTGHINDTFAATFRQTGGTKRFILQRINHHVFKDIEGLMSNIVAVTGYLSRKIRAAGGDPLRETLTLVPTRAGRSYHQTAGGEFWRAYVFIEGARTYESVERMEHVHAAGRAYGDFQNLLRDFPSETLIETIPGFHHTGRRFENFLDAVEADVANRARAATREIEFVTSRAHLVPVLVELTREGKLRTRITHNDTKFNNVMIDDRTGAGVCVIDLDTVMPGLSLYDFGDSIRSMANTGAEDEPDLSRVDFDLQVYASYARGYLEATGGFLDREELELLPLAAILMTLECGMRFLEDHLRGDIYFKTTRPDHNLDRCRTQFKLVEGMEQAQEAMSLLVEESLAAGVDGDQGE